MTYREALLRAIDGWKTDPIPDEWLFERFRSGTIGAMSAPEAFEAIGETIEILLLEVDESTSIEILQSILNLAIQSDTTEIPEMLLRQKDDLQLKFACFDDYANHKLQELFGYYRI